MNDMNETGQAKSPLLVELARQAHSAGSHALAAILENYFDPTWYSGQYPDVRKAGMDPALHFLHHGFQEGRLAGPGLQARHAATVCRPAYNGEERNADKTPLLNRMGSYEALYDIPLWVNWILTGMCNYQCSYCFGQYKIDKSKFPSFQKLLNVVENIARLNRPYYDFTITGGEVTILPYLTDFLWMLATRFGQKLRHIDLLTNGSRDIPFWGDINAIAKHMPLSVTCSIHSEHACPDHIYNLVQTLQNNAHLNISIIFNPSRFDFVRSVYENLLELRKECFFELSIVIVRERPHFNKPDSRYTPEHVAWQEESQVRFENVACNSQKQSPLGGHYRYRLFWETCNRADASLAYERVLCNNLGNSTRQHLYRQGYYNFQSMYCVAGAHLLTMFPDYTGWTLNCGKGKTWGNLANPAWTPPGNLVHIVKCDVPGCGCSAQDPLCKFRVEEEALEFAKCAQQKHNRLLVSPGTA